MKKIILTLLALPLVALNVASAENTSTDPDNSARNKSDRNGANVTPIDQSNAEADLNVVQAIRKAIIADDALSMNAKNVKVVTDATRVVLRGPVKSAEEKTTIERITKEHANGRTIQNLLEVETQE